MNLSAVSYSERSRDPHEWKLEKLVLGDINLLVGKNATGKTRSLNIINGLANLLSGRKRELSDGEWNTEFVDDDYRFHYKLKIKGREVVSEQLVRFIGWPSPGHATGRVQSLPSRGRAREGHHAYKA